MVINKNTDVDKCIAVALNQYIEKGLLSELYRNLNIQSFNRYFAKLKI